MMDVDKVSCCIACNEPLFLAETVKHNGQELIKGHSMIRQLAIKSGLPAFIIWYKLVGDEMPLYVYVKKIAPDYKDGYTSDPIKLNPDQWLQFLEHKQVEHYPHCAKQSFFDKKLTQDPVANRRKAFAPILHK